MLALTFNVFLVTQHLLPVAVMLSSFIRLSYLGRLFVCPYPGAVMCTPPPLYSCPFLLEMGLGQLGGRSLRIGVMLDANVWRLVHSG